MSSNAALIAKVCHVFFGIALVLVVFFAGGTLVLLLAWDKYGMQKLWDLSTLGFLGAAAAYVATYYFSVREARKAGASPTAVAWASAPAIPLLLFIGIVILG